MYTVYPLSPIPVPGALAPSLTNSHKTEVKVNELQWMIITARNRNLKHNKFKDKKRKCLPAYTWPSP